MQPPKPRPFAPDPYVWCASLLLLLTLLLTTGFSSRYWLELRIQQQIEDLTRQSQEVITAANHELANSITQLSLLSQTLTELSSTQRFIHNFAATRLVQTDLDIFHHRFQLLGIWLLNKQGKVLVKSKEALAPSNLITVLKQESLLAQAKPWSRLLFDSEHQQAEHYYALPLPNRNGLTLVVGAKLAKPSNDFQRIRLLITDPEDTILFADDKQWLGYQFTGLKNDPAPTELKTPHLPLTISPIQPQVLLLGKEEAPKLWLSQSSLSPRVHLHALADASQIQYQTSVKNNLAAIIAVTITGASWGGLLSVLTIRRNRQHQRTLNAAHQELLRLNSKLSHLADTDTLTECPNRRAAYSRLSQELLQLRTYRQAFCVVLLDLDFFKAINDNHGHDAGDQILAYFAQTARNTLRASDFLARIGGEEFLLILPNTHRQQALPLAQRLLDTISASPLYLSDKTIPFTFSGGLVEAKEEDDIQHLLQRADRYLYAAKQRGRCQIIDSQAYAAQDK